MAAVDDAHTSTMKLSQILGEDVLAEPIFVVAGDEEPVLLNPCLCETRSGVPSSSPGMSEMVHAVPYDQIEFSPGAPVENLYFGFDDNSHMSSISSNSSLSEAPELKASPHEKTDGSQERCEFSLVSETVQCVIGAWHEMLDEFREPIYQRHCNGCSEEAEPICPRLPAEKFVDGTTPQNLSLINMDIQFMVFGDKLDEVVDSEFEESKQEDPAEVRVAPIAPLSSEESPTEEEKCSSSSVTEDKPTEPVLPLESMELSLEGNLLYCHIQGMPPMYLDSIPTPIPKALESTHPATNVEKNRSKSNSNKSSRRPIDLFTGILRRSSRKASTKHRRSLHSGRTIATEHSDVSEGDDRTSVLASKTKLLVTSSMKG
eukprot:Nitzschia sp. Nitz4//scaffold46_size129759//27056//28174//NITZ4_003488-RA/size129759-processed-gene-0.191-mRNA-1//1//CDS//3329552556//8524//frame0